MLGFPHVEEGAIPPTTEPEFLGGLRELTLGTGQWELASAAGGGESEHSAVQ